jgi:hypothetical protein
MTQLLDLGKLRFHFAGDWLESTVYEANDVVKYGGNVYVYTYGLKTSGNLPTDSTFWALMVEGFQFTGPFDTTTQYRVGDGVAHGGKVYIAVADSTNQTPPNPTYWSQFADGIQYEGEYNNGSAYQRNDVVIFGGVVYIAKVDTTGNLPTDATYWDRFVDGISPEGVYNSGTSYVVNDLVAYGANIYRCTANSTGNVPTDTDYWEIFVGGFDFVGPWSTGQAYEPDQVVSHGGNSYIVLVAHVSTVFETDLDAGKWQKFTSGVRWRGQWGGSTVYLKDDIVKNSVGTAYIATEDHTSGADFGTDLTAGKWVVFVVGGADVLPELEIGDQGRSLTVLPDGSSLDWIGATASDKVFYVGPDGEDAPTAGQNMAYPFASIRYACDQALTGATIFVKTGTYTEQLPIVVPEGVAIVGDNQRTVIVQPAAGLSDDEVTPNNQSAMFLMSNASILNKMTFVGMTGWVPGTTPEDIETSTIKGVVVKLNPDSPILHKSPYVLECSAICNGAIGALIDGSEHVTGARSMIFHGYTVISDNGVGYWVKDDGKAEIVSCFTYYCYFGYSSTGGGHIRALNGNNSYGTWGTVSQGFSSAEVAITGTLVGRQLNFNYNDGPIDIGTTVTGETSGATATVTNVQYTADKVYVKDITGTFEVGEDLTFLSGGTGTVAPEGLEDQKGFVLVADGFSQAPRPGQSIQLADDTVAYVIQSVSGTFSGSASEMILVLAQEKPTGSADNTVVTLRSQYSQIRLTGHDFLNIGTGGVTTTNYPGVPTQPPAQGNETNETYPGRVFYVTTDQDGNFRVGEYFRIDQATGRATLNANAFDLAGLTSLRLGSIGAQLGETINEFSSDSTMSGNSNTAVPTEYAVKAYVDQSVSNLVDSAPGALDTLNELAAALDDDANFSTTVTNALAARLQLSGGTMTGPITLSGDPAANLQAATKQYVDTGVNSAASTASAAQSTADSKASKAGDTFTGPVVFQSNIYIEAVRERTSLDSSTSGTLTVDTSELAVVFLTLAQAANRTINIRGNASTTLNTLMGVGESLTVAVLFTNGGTAYRFTGFQIDGSNVAPRWQGGAAPTAGNANSIDSYTFTVVKTGNSAFTMLAGLTRFT